MIEVLFEDEYILAVNKPNNVLVHHSDMSRNMEQESSLVELLLDAFNKQYCPIHRLDRKTSGVIVFAKEKQFVKDFQVLFQSEKEIQKTYLGLVRGFIAESGKVDSPVKGRDANVYKDAFTTYKRLKTFEFDIPVGPYNTSRYSLIELLPTTGRMHQLRIHMNKINHPLIGDPKYGDRFHNRMFADKFDTENLFLHAQQLEFKHPFSNEIVLLKASLPMHWEKFYKR